MDQGKLKDYELVKVIAVILVVLAHSTIIYTGQGVVIPINESTVFKYISQYISSFAMPLFVAVSGSIYYYLRQELCKYNDVRNFVNNKSKRLLIPYIVFGILYVSPVMVEFNFTNDSFIKYVINGIVLSGNSRNLWYVFMLFNVFIIVYFVEKYVNKMPKYLSIAAVFIIYILSFKLIIRVDI